MALYLAALAVLAVGLLAVLTFAPVLSTGPSPCQCGAPSTDAPCSCPPSTQTRVDLVGPLLLGAAAALAAGGVACSFPGRANLERASGPSADPEIVEEPSEPTG